jgi:hypothetical protein
MKADVRSSAEKEALEWAIGYFREHAEQMTPWSVPPMVWTADDAAIEKLAAMATVKADEGAAYWLREIAARRINRGEPLPRMVAKFVELTLRLWPHPIKMNLDPVARDECGVTLKVDRAKPKRGQRDYEHASRDAMIVMGMELITERWGFAPTRGEATRELASRKSAASIVCAALRKAGVATIKETAVNKIWSRVGLKRCKTN